MFSFPGSALNFCFLSILELPGEIEVQGIQGSFRQRAAGIISIPDCSFSLTEHLSKPKVTMGLQNNKNGTCLTNLTCSMEQGGDDVTYSWKALGQGGNKSYNGSILPISWRLGARDMTFICLARNPVSSNSSSPILAWKLCKGDRPFFLGASGLSNCTFFNSLSPKE